MTPRLESETFTEWALRVLSRYEVAPSSSPGTPNASPSKGSARKKRQGSKKTAVTPQEVSL